MKTPIFETYPGATLALLFATGPGGRSFAYFDLYTITCVQGPVLRYTTCDVDVGYGGAVWSSSGVRIEPANQRNALFHSKVGLDVDSWQAVFYPRAVDDLTGAAYPDTIGSTPWLAAAAAGALDGATVTVDRAYFALPLSSVTLQTTGHHTSYYTIVMPTPLLPTGVLRIFAGRVAEVDLGRSGACVTVNSHLELLNVQIPVNLFQAGCSHKLFDAGCTLAASSFSVAGTCTAGSSQYQLISAIVPPPGSGTFTLGRVMMTSGLNAGFSRSVRSWAQGVNLYFVSPLPFDVAVGDTFTAYAGCDKTYSTCQAFQGSTNAELNFGGSPFIPSPETAS